MKKGERNILIIVSNFSQSGGAQKIAAWLTKQLNKNQNVYIITFSKSKREFQYAGTRMNFNDRGILEKITFPPLLRILFWFKILTRSLKISRVCRKHKIDIAISFLESASFPSILSKYWGNKTKIIVTIRNMPYEQSPLSRTAMRVLYKRVDGIVAVTKKMKGYLQDEMGLSKITTIYNPMHLKQEGEISSGLKFAYQNKSFVFINIGRLVPQKGHKYLIQAFQKVIKIHPHCRLVILGKGELHNSLEELIKNLRLKDRVILAGDQENVYPFLKKSDCFVLSSLWEGFPNVLIEALSVNLPIISTDCETGPREILTPNLKINKTLRYPFIGQHGVLIKPFDSQRNNHKKTVTMLANAMIDIVENPETYQKKSSTPIFTEEKIIKQWNLLIENIGS